MGKRSEKADRNAEGRRLAHDRLDELIDWADADLYGLLALDVEFQAGDIVRVAQRMERSDKPSRHSP